MRRRAPAASAAARSPIPPEGPAWVAFRGPSGAGTRHPVRCPRRLPTDASQQSAAGGPDLTAGSKHSDRRHPLSAWAPCGVRPAPASARGAPSVAEPAHRLPSAAPAAPRPQPASASPPRTDACAGRVPSFSRRGAPERRAHHRRARHHLPAAGARRRSTLLPHRGARPQPQSSRGFVVCLHGRLTPFPCPFPSQATMVAEQGELAIRIDENVEARLRASALPARPLLPAPCSARS